MEKKKYLSDIFFAPFWVICTFACYCLWDFAFGLGILEELFIKLLMFIAMTSWIAIAYLSVRKKFRNIVYNPIYNLIAVAVTSFLIPLIFWFLHCCCACLNEYGSIVKAPVIFVNVYLKSILIAFWFVYCCVACLLIHVGDTRHWVNKIARYFGYVFNENTVDIKENTLVLPFKYKERKAKLYFAVNGKGMLFCEDDYEYVKEYSKKLMEENPANEDAINFSELLNDAMELVSEDGKIFTFDADNSEKFKWDNYEIREEAFWHELLPLNLAKHDEDGEKKKFTWSKVFSLSFLLPPALFIGLTFALFDKYQNWVYWEDGFISGIKYVSYILLMIAASSVCNRFIVNKESSKKKKVLTCTISTLAVLAIIMLLNSTYHFFVFGDKFDWPEGITYFKFLREEALYHQGIGMLRYPAVIVLYIAVYFCGYYNVIGKWWKKFKKTLVEILSSDNE